MKVTAATEGAGFDCALRLVNARNLKIDGMRIRGDRDARGNSIGIDIGGQDSPVDSFITKASCYFLNRGINIDGTVEGIYLSQSVFVAMEHGIYARVPHPSPLLFVENCHINAFVSCIDVSNIVQFDLSHNLLYASKPRKALPMENGRTGFVAISVAMHENVGLTSRISGNTIIGTTQIDIPKNGIYVDGENAEFSLSIDNNELVGWDMGVILGRGSRGVVVASSNRYRSNHDAVLDMSGRNTVASQSVAPNGSVRDGSGLETKWGTDIVTFDAAGKGHLALKPPFKSKFLFGICANGDATSVGRVFVLVDDANSTNAQMRFLTSPPPATSPYEFNG